MTIAEGTRYFVIVEGSRTECSYLREAQHGARTVHLLAVPAEAMGEPSPRDREIRSYESAEEGTPRSGSVTRPLRVRVVCVSSTAALRRPRGTRGSLGTGRLHKPVRRRKIKFSTIKGVKIPIRERVDIDMY